MASGHNWAISMERMYVSVCDGRQLRADGGVAWKVDIRLQSLKSPQGSDFYDRDLFHAAR
jgi:hypothetical protein